VPGLWRGLLGLQRLLVAFTLGAGVAAVYAMWQWPAQRYGLPLADILTTRDSNAITEGGNQGPGLLGWERARGTFLEPHFLGGFMSAAAPIAVLAAAQARGAVRALALAGAAAMCGAVIVSSSAPAFAGFGIAAVVAGTAWAVGSGRPTLAAVAAAGAAFAVLAAPALVAAPEVLAAATGRDATTLTATADFRKQTWNRVLDIWAAQPAGGYGAGQSSVRLSLVTQGPRAVGLNSAQGLWASSLLDVGLVGLGLWIALLGAALALVLRNVASGPSLQLTMLLMAVVAALCSMLVAGDRLDLRLWLLLGIVAAASLRRAGTTSER
jgi:O-antigen ligase